MKIVIAAVLTTFILVISMLARSMSIEYGQDIRIIKTGDLIRDVERKISQTDRILVDIETQRQDLLQRLAIVDNSIKGYEAQRAMLVIEKISLESSIVTPKPIKIIPKKLVHATRPELNDLINYAYQVGGIDFVLTINAENQPWDHLLKSKPNPNGYSDVGLCQLHRKYHAPFIDSPDFQDPRKQVDYCREVWQDAVRKGRLESTFVAYARRYTDGWAIKIQ